MNPTRIVLLSLPVVLAACSLTPPPSVSLIPLEDGSYRTISIAQNEQQALAGSLQVAQSTCRELKLQHVVSSVDTRFRGAWSNPHDRQEQAAQLGAYVSSPTFPSLEANDDYEVKLKFKCV